MQAYNPNNLNIREILDRIKEHAGVRFDTDLAVILDVDRLRPGKWASKGTIPYDTLINWAQEKNISLNWLFAGHGPVTITELENRLIAEESPAYGKENDADYTLFNRVAKVVRGFIKDAGIKIKNDADQEKLDYLLYYCYNQVKKENGEIDKNNIESLVKLAM